MKFILIFIFLIVSSGCGSQSGTASDVNGSSSTAKRWNKKQFPLKIYIPQSISEEYKNAIELSMADWNTALNTTALVAVYEPAIENKQWEDYSEATEDSFFGLYSIIKTVWNKYKLSSGTIAITTSKYYPSTGQMVHADILFNENFNFFDYRSGYLCRSSSLVNNQQKCAENKSCQWQESESDGVCENIYPQPATDCQVISNKSLCRLNYGCGWRSNSNECSVNSSKQNNSIDYRTSLTHELGHFLGLGHTDSTKCPESRTEMECKTNDSCIWSQNSCVGDSLSIMGASITKGEVKKITDGDNQRVNSLYK